MTIIIHGTNGQLCKLEGISGVYEFLPHYIDFFGESGVLITRKPRVTVAKMEVS